MVEVKAGLLVGHNEWEIPGEGGASQRIRCGTKNQKIEYNQGGSGKRPALARAPRLPCLSPAIQKAFHHVYRMPNTIIAKLIASSRRKRGENKRISGIETVRVALIRIRYVDFVEAEPR